MPRFAGTKQRQNEHGTVLLMATVTIFVLVGMLALAVDVGFLMNGRGQLQNVVDAAALAGAHGLRTAIEPAGSTSQQIFVARSLARDFAHFNPIAQANGLSGLNLSDDDILIDYPPDYPTNPARITVKHRTALPTIFGNVFGISSMNISAAAIASSYVVDGGTGFVSGCWRPILIPDTFYDRNNVAWAVSANATFSDGTTSPSRPISPGATQDGDVYVSRFASFNAGSNRNQTQNFLQSVTTGVPTGEATGIRDAYNLGELKSQGGRNLIGHRIKLSGTAFPGPDWRIINFSTSVLSGNFNTGDFPTDPVQQISKGCCVNIRVGDFVQVFTPTDDNIGIYTNFAQELTNYFTSILATGGNSTSASQQYRYGQTTSYPTPNANPRVIPVLMCSPIQFSNSRNTNQFYVTNIGAFYLEQVSPDGSITGMFVREVVTAGTPVEQKDQVPNTTLLPVSVRLVR